jgi:hypothetical protein
MFGSNRKDVKKEDVRREILVLVREGNGTENASEANIVSAASSKTKLGKSRVKGHLLGIEFEGMVSSRNGIYKIENSGEEELARLLKQRT